ncbi:MAG TPA: tetratricopeptide repeat protein [Bryobacteraceae bacterium]|nr:tetratricopeptide repeat protein [Bryobacteraceae bacterium]
MARIRIIPILLAAVACAQTPDPAYQPLDRAYKALRAKDYDAAMGGFREAVALAPQRAAIHVDLAYTLLKIGENEAARDQFGEAMRLQPADEHVALEYAFLCYETKKQAEARRIFDRIRHSGNATAEQAFQNIDRPLSEGIARWQTALESSPNNFSAHYELARLAEQRDEIPLAAEHYEKAWRIKPEERELLLDLGRVWQAKGEDAKAFAALLAASRGAQPRIAERARELLPSRYPYVYEFNVALELDPGNVDLRRELAYLLLQMDNGTEAEKQFEAVHRQAPDDRLTTAQLGLLKLARHEDGAQPLLEEVLNGPDDELSDRVRSALKMPQSLRRREDTPRPQVTEKARAMADKSFNAGYLKDALKYYNIAHESDPVDFGVMLKLGWTYNMLHDDRSAVEWFRLARQSSDPAQAKEADQAWKNLESGTRRFHVTTWMFPFFSTRWHDMFGYGQTRADLNLGSLPFHIYASARVVGDTRETTTLPGIAQVQYLSENSVIVGLGIASRSWHGLTGCAEAGESMKYLGGRSMTPDYRGGASYARGYGHAGGGMGLFAETNGDAVFVSRFNNDLLFYPQIRTGYSFGSVQGYWNYDLTSDISRQYWANFVETGPGVRFHLPSTPKSLLFSVNGLRGAYLVNAGNPRRPNFDDIRAGFWYAFTR